MTLAIIIRKTQYCLYFCLKRGRKKPTNKLFLNTVASKMRAWSFSDEQWKQANYKLSMEKIAYVIQCFRYFAESRGWESDWCSSWFKGALERLISHCLGAVVTSCKDVFEDPFANPVVRGMLTRSWDPGACWDATALCSTAESGRPWGQ